MSEPTDYMAEALGSDDEVACRECGDTLGQVTASHLSLHGMTVDEYREKYPDAPLVPDGARTGWDPDKHGDDTRRKISEAITELHKEGHYDA